jgi:hypothetical protein
MGIADSLGSRTERDAVRLEDDTVNLVEMHRQVVGRSGRIALQTRDGATSILMSSGELSAMEKALSILSDTDDVRAMRDHLAQMVAAMTRL